MLSQTAQNYLNAGLCVLPAIRAEKRPAIGAWKRYQDRLPTEAEISAWMSNSQDALCILCGAASNQLEMIDFDAQGELFLPWLDRIPKELANRLVIESTPSGGMHVVYRCEVPVCGNLKLAQRKSGDKIITLIETRGQGGLFLCAPTPGYELVQGDMTALPVLTAGERDILLQAAWDLNEYMPPVVDGPNRPANVGQRGGSSAENGQLSANPPHNGHGPSDNGHHRPISADMPHLGGCPPENTDRPGDDFNVRGDVRAVLEQAGWVRVREGGSGGNEYWRRPGKESGWSATLKVCSEGRMFYVFSANAAPFEPNRAYSPFSVFTLLHYGGDFEQAARSLRQLGYGGDIRASLADNHPDIDISGIVGHVGQAASHNSNKAHGAADNPHIGGYGATITDIAEGRAEIADPGPMPEEMLRLPGFIGEVMDHCLATAPYPNPVMAFAGALSLQAFLAGRKVRDSGDNRTNIYLLGLAHSAAGKDWPRKINTRIVNEVGLADCLGERFASGEGIQDALFQTPSMLFQTDEIDGMLQSINKAKDARHEAIMSTLLTMYSSSNSVFPMRRKAGTAGMSPGVIDQPCLVIFGTAIPNHYYEALSERMLTNGFFARMIILEAGQRGSGQEPSIRDLPQRVLETAKWWASYQPGDQHANLLDRHPLPAIVDHTDAARRLLVETREQAESEYASAEAKSDAVGTTVWGRVSEQTRRLALLYAISQNYKAPSIGIEAVRWASRFVMHQTRRMLFMAAGHVAENPFHAECLKAVEKLRNAPGNELPHSVLLKRMKMDSKSFGMLLETLVQQGDIEIATTARPGWHVRSYRLASGVNHGGETSAGGET